MTYWIDPLNDPRWNTFIDRHPASSVFHTSGWLRALKETYNFTPTAITESTPDRSLESAIPFCYVSSFLTGKRLSSLPFSDHCQPLADPAILDSLTQTLVEDQSLKQYKYVEIRPLKDCIPPAFGLSQRFLLHSLDLSPGLEELFHNLHGNCVRRKIRRAEREGLEVESGANDSLVDAFFTLQLHTRRKHGLPPQPKQWFLNLVREMQGAATIRVARYSGRPVASIMTLRHRNTETYKYGCSEAEDNNLGGMQLLFWHAIRDAKAAGMKKMDLGRCDLDNEGLARFKERLGAERREMTYFRYPAGVREDRSKTMSLASKVFSNLPDSLLAVSGRILYRHFA